MAAESRKQLKEVKGNHQRLNRHTFDPVEAKIRASPREGDQRPGICARYLEIRCYAYRFIGTLDVTCFLLRCCSPCGWLRETPDVPLKQPQIAVPAKTVALTYGAGKSVYFARSEDAGKSFSRR